MRLASRNLFRLYHLKSNTSTGILVVQAVKLRFGDLFGLFVCYGLLKRSLCML